jgi:hypothetical protein
MVYAPEAIPNPFNKLRGALRLRLPPLQMIGM